MVRCGPRSTRLNSEKIQNFQFQAQSANFLRKNHNNYNKGKLPDFCNCPKNGHTHVIEKIKNPRFLGIQPNVTQNGQAQYKTGVSTIPYRRKNTVKVQNCIF